MSQNTLTYKCTLLLESVIILSNTFNNNLVSVASDDIYNNEDKVLFRVSVCVSHLMERGSWSLSYYTGYAWYHRQLTEWNQI